ncbi:type VII secretion protein EssC [Paenibacillus sp. J22TS3]|uniref:type VII secretion protein EssC n=1 Tax=Paenibacillus sp. J22TS3 TaxID=2807192 RepID=UPI001BCB7DA4|nr:type VII secretion protein EssC [Paenibacillus sp. J22TS3]
MSTLYQRSPRIKKSLEAARYEIVKPPDLPARPVMSPLLFVGPSVIAAAVLSFIIYINFSRSEISGMMVISEILGILLAGSLFAVPFLVHRSQLRRYALSADEREAKYRGRLDKIKLELEALADEQRQAMLEVHNHPESAILVASERSPSLWERSPRDSDFLEVRAGTGDVPFKVDIQPPQKDGFTEDPLTHLAGQLAGGFSVIPDCPVTLPLPEAKVIGIVGEPEDTSNLIRAVVAQIAISHSPDEVKLAAFINEGLLQEWSWLRFFPHVWDEGKKRRFLAGNRLQAHELAEKLYHLIQPRIRQDQPVKTLQDAGPWYVTVITDSRLVEDEALYPLLLDQDESLQACTIIMADSTENLPRQCRLIIECDGAEAEYLYRNPDGTVMNRRMIVDRLSVQQADTLARTMAPIELKKSAAGEIPSTVTLLELLGVHETEGHQLADIWERHRFPRLLPLPLGVRAGGKVMQLQLHDKIEHQGHGPHGLIAGMTGSGKSELLQSLVSAAAMNYHPHDINFLLIDYKGGGMSNSLEAFPHVVGTLTNLDKRLIQRAKISLRAELVRRQMILKDAGNLQHIDEYYQLKREEPLPHLIVVIDEFAELKRDHPDFMDELISIAAIGRTLGLHLILATQKPSGVVDDKIWSNARFRICLRVQDESDSRDMIKLPDAAWIHTAGRGYFQVGSGEVFEQLQFAWAGAPYERSGAPKQTQVYKVALNGEKLPIGSQTTREANANPAPKQLQAIIDYVRQTAGQLGIQRLKGPWLEPLPEMIGPLVDSGEESGDQPLTAVVGLADDVAEQQQIAARLAVSEGHLLIYGMPGSGKTTFIQTFLMSLARRYTPEEWSGYIVDMGRTMREYGNLPHIGNVITPEDQDRMARLFRYLAKESNERRQLLMEAGVKTAAEYRRLAHQPLPEVVTVIDGYYMFKLSFPAQNEQLDVLLREGPALGLSFLVSANRLGDIPEKFRSSISRTAAFQIADPHDYPYMGLRIAGAGLESAQPPGRGHFKLDGRIIEFQCSLPAPGGTESEVNEQLKQQIAELDSSWSGKRPQPIRELPAWIALHSLLEQGGGNTQASLGIRVEDLSPLAVDLDSGPHYIVGAPMEGGKTSFLISWILSLAWSHTPEEIAIYAVDGRHSSREISGLSQVPHVKGCASGDKGLAAIVDELLDSGESNAAPNSSELSSPARKVLFIDDADVLARQMQDFALKDKLTSLVRKSRELGVHIILSGVPSDFPTFGADWFSEIKNCQSGFLLGSRDANDLSFFRIPIAEAQAVQGELPVLPPGQGYYVRRKYEKFKAALPFDSAWTRADWIKAISEKWKVLVGEEVG